MSEKKSLLNTLFGGKPSGCCNMQITEAPKETPKKGGCCDMKIVPAEETRDQSGKQSD